MNAYILFFNGSTDLNIFYTYLDIIRDTQSKISVKEMKSCQQQCALGYQPPLKNTPLSFLPTPPVKSANCPSPPF